MSVVFARRGEKRLTQGKKSAGCEYPAACTQTRLPTSRALYLIVRTWTIEPLSRTGYAILDNQYTRSPSPDLCASVRAARQADHAKDPTMQPARRRLIIVAALLALLLTVSPTEARWRNADIGGFVNMERVCRDGALVSIVLQSDGGADTTGTVGARRHDNLAAAPEPDKSTGNGTPRPLDDYGPNIVAAPQLRDVTITSQSLAREVDLDRGNGMPDIAQKYGISVLPWSAPQTPGTPVILVYRRSNDSLDVGIAEEIVADCTIGVGNTTTIAASALPGGASAIPAAQLTYQVAGWPSHGQLRRDSLPLAPGTRFSAADLTGHPLTYATSRTPRARSAADQRRRHRPGLADRRSAGQQLLGQQPGDLGRWPLCGVRNLCEHAGTKRYQRYHRYFRLRSAGRADFARLGQLGRRRGRQWLHLGGDLGRWPLRGLPISGEATWWRLDANNASDVFVHDRQTGQTTRVSVSSSGAEAQGDSDDPAISADGRYVAFVSDAANLVAGDTGGYRQCVSARPADRPDNPDLSWFRRHNGGRRFG